MQMIVVGCGRLGAELAYGLYRKGHDVVVIDQRASEFANLAQDFRGRTLEGDVLARDLLNRAGMPSADGVAAVTNSDAVNAVVGHLARTEYQVPTVVIRNYNPRWLSLVESFGVRVISSASWGARRMEEILGGQLHTVFSAGNGEVEVYEFSVPAAWAGRGLTELQLDAESLPIALTRGGRAEILIDGRPFLAGDVLHVAATPAAAERLRERLAGSASLRAPEVGE